MKDSYRVLLLGSGAREHAMAMAMDRSPLCSRLWVVPGNAGTEAWKAPEPVDWRDATAFTDFLLRHEVDFLVIGPEDPLVAGLVDRCKEEEALKGLLVLGPGRAGAALEGSKDFSKSFMQKYGIPTAKATTYDASRRPEAEEVLRSAVYPLVLKADGLAAGKGVVVCQNAGEALETLDRCWSQRKFGDSGNKILFEHYLQGIELSVFVLCDGKDYVLLPEAKDYKRVGEGDTGPNTGGMGAVSPLPFVSRDWMHKIEERIIRPTLKGLEAEGILYQGFLFVGLMKVGEDPMVIEYNVRMGDPETEVVLPRIQSDVLEGMIRAAMGHLSGWECVVDRRTAVTTVVCSQGYPGDLTLGRPVQWSEPEAEGQFLFHAGTARNEDAVVNKGGRVVAATALHEDPLEALKGSQVLAGGIAFEGAFYRKDIGLDLMKPV